MPVFAPNMQQMEQARQDFLYRATQAIPVPANVDVSTTLHDEGVLRFQEKEYRVPRIPWRMGQRLLLLDIEYRQLKSHANPPREMLQQLLVVIDLIADLCWSLVAVPWWVRRWRPNPFRDAEEQEMDTIRSFFLHARTRSSVAVIYSIRAPQWLQPIQWTPYTHSRVGIHAIWRKLVTPLSHAVIAISNTGSPASTMNR